MRSPRRILVPVDFGEASAHAVSLGGSLARHCGAVLRLLHAEWLEAPPYFTPEQITSLEAQRRATRQQAERYLAHFGETHTTHPFTPVISDHAAVDAILHAALEADLVVMGTHGRRGPKRWWLGSVAERVLRGIDRPLLVVRGDAPLEADAAFRRTVVHAAAPLHGVDALDYAREISRCFGGEAIDARHTPVEPSLSGSTATMIVAAMPAMPGAGWLAGFGERVVRDSRVPVLFVPDSAEGVSA